MRFPIGDMSRIPGYDGQTNMNGVSHTYVPDGKTVWELKTSKDFVTKANEDFKKRSEDPKGIDKTTTTYVFVSSKTWKNGKKSKEQWINKKKEEDPDWKGIKIIDAVDLEQWIESCPAVGSNFAKKAGKAPQAGAQGTEEFWDCFINRYGPAINEEIILTSRKEQAQELIRKLLDEQSSHKMQADSVDEVIAFVIAAIYSSEKEIRDRLTAKTLILDSEEAVNFFSHQKGMIFIAKPHIAPLCGPLLNGNTLIRAAGRKGPKNNSTILTRPTAYELSESLKTIGYTEEDAIRAAKECGGSITILSSRRPSVESKEPDWVGTHGKIIIPAMLAGGWDEDNDNDAVILSSLSAKKKYEDYQEEILQTLTLEDSPIERENSIWKMIAPVDAFLSLGSQMPTKDYERLKKASIDVFSEIDPNIEEPNEDEPYRGFSRKPYKYSEWLRDGLATSLLQIAALHKELGLHIQKTTPQQFVNDLVNSLPGLRNDPRVIISLKKELPMLMEAAPTPFLDALEHMLEGNKDVLKAIFNEKNDSLFSTGHHHNLLWGLEGLAWDPSLLKRVSLILAKLAKIDPGGSTINRPINSLREIFLLWHPGTNANIEQRFSAIDALTKKEPDVTWDLIERILPEYHGTSHNTHKPLYREAGASNKEILTWGVIWASHRELMKRAIKLAANNPERWKLILSTLSRLKPDLRLEIIEKFKHAVTKMNKQQKTACWNFMRDYINKNLSFPDADWVLPEGELNALNAFFQTLEPSDLLEKFKWLFDDYHPDLPDSKYDFEHSEKKLKETRLDAVNAIYNAYGIDGIINLIELIAEPQILASVYSDADYDLDVYRDTIQQAHGKGKKLSHFCFALSSSLQYKFPDWAVLFLDMMHENTWSDALKAQLILAWPDTKETWDIVTQLGKNIEDLYWKEKRAWRGRGLDLPETEHYARKLLDYQRATSAISVVYEHANEINLQLIFEILDNAVQEINELQSSNNTMLGYYIEKIFDALSTRKGVNEQDLAAREYVYLTILERRSNTLTLHKLLAKDPGFYISVICDVFKPSNSEGRPATEENHLKAQAAYRLLSSFKKIPGAVGSIIDIGPLRSWTQEVLKLAKEKDRVEITEQHVGSLFAHAPGDPEDNAWPHKTIRELIEELASDDVETGISVEKFNMRGIYSKAIFEGGRQERELAQQSYEWAKTCKDWPRTHDMLIKIGESWDSHAESEDQRAKLDRMKG